MRCDGAGGASPFRGVVHAAPGVAVGMAMVGALAGEEAGMVAGGPLAGEALRGKRMGGWCCCDAGLLTPQELTEAAHPDAPRVEGAGTAAAAGGAPIAEGR